MLLCLKEKTNLKQNEDQKKHFNRGMLLSKVGVVNPTQGSFFWKHGDRLRNVTLLGDPTPA